MDQRFMGELLLPFSWVHGPGSKEQQKKLAVVDSILLNLLDLHNSSDDTRPHSRPHSIIAKEMNCKNHGRRSCWLSTLDLWKRDLISQNIKNQKIRSPKTTPKLIRKGNVYCFIVTDKNTVKFRK